MFRTRSDFQSDFRDALLSASLPVFMVQTTTDPAFFLTTFDPGLDYVSSYLFSTRTFDPEVLLFMHDALLQTSFDKLFVDVGAHVGIMTIYAAKLGARVIAFEPSSANRQLLEQNIKLNQVEANVSVVPFAVSDEPGEACLYSAPYNSGNSFLEGYGPSYGASDGQPCESVPISTLSDHVFEHIYFLKIDTEGNDIRVLDGARSLFEQYGWPEYLQIEVYYLRTLRSGKSPLDLLYELADRGYRLHSLFVRYGQEVPLEQFEMCLPSTDIILHRQLNCPSII